MAEYTMDDVFEDVVLSIGDSRFRLRERTQSLGKKVEKLQEQTKVDEDTPDDAAMESTLELIDLLLEPLGDGNNGTRTHAKTILSKAYKNDEIGADRIFALLNFCQDKMLGRMDPTSRLPSDG